MTRARDQFIASVFILKNRPKMLQELVREVERQKKTGDLSAEEGDVILEEVRRVYNR
jgi:hypothetical protein